MFFFLLWSLEPLFSNSWSPRALWPGELLIKGQNPVALNPFGTLGNCAILKE